MLLNIIWIVIGFVLLVFGADWLVDGASDLAKRIGMPDRVVGLTIVSIGTSLPELVVGITSVSSGYATMAFGNVMGSCVANLMLILGITAIIQPVPLSRSSYRFEMPMSILAAGLLMILANTGSELVAWEGVILTLAFFAFLAKTVVDGLKEGAATADADDDESIGYDFDDEDELPKSRVRRLSLVEKVEKLFEKPRSIILNILIIALSIAMLKYGADFVVDNATLVAEALGVSEKIIGVTIVALGTCLPELAASVAAALRGNTDIALGNVVGSNISNVLLVMGVPSILATMYYDVSYNFDFILLMVGTAALVIYALVMEKTGRRRVMTRLLGIIYVMVYVAYIMVTAIA